MPLAKRPPRKPPTPLGRPPADAGGSALGRRRDGARRVASPAPRPAAQLAPAQRRAARAARARPRRESAARRRSASSRTAFIASRASSSSALSRASPVGVRRRLLGAAAGAACGAAAATARRADADAAPDDAAALCTEGDLDGAQLEGRRVQLRQGLLARAHGGEVALDGVAPPSRARRLADGVTDGGSASSSAAATPPVGSGAPPRRRGRRYRRRCRPTRCARARGLVRAPPTGGGEMARARCW